MLTIGDKIKAIRKERGLTQKEFAKKLNKSERMIQKYENSEVEPKLEILKEICNKLNVDMADLIDSNVIDKNRLFSIMKSKNITIEQLSKETEIPINILNQYINNKELVTESDFEILYKITDYFGINSDYILNKTDFKFFEDDEIASFELIFEAIKNNSSDDIKINSRDILEYLFLVLLDPILGEHTKLLSIYKKMFENIYELNSKLVIHCKENKNISKESIDLLKSIEEFFPKQINEYKEKFSKQVDELVEYYSSPEIAKQETLDSIYREINLKKSDYKLNNKKEEK